MEERRIADRREKTLEPCPVCHSTDIFDKGYGVECCNCSLWLEDNEKTRELGGYIHLWNNRLSKPILKDFL
jgi:hypothetical protein